MTGGYGDESGLSGLQRARRAVVQLGISPAETAALALLVAGAIAALGLLWMIGRPEPVASGDAGAAGEAGEAGEAGAAGDPASGLAVTEEPLVVAVTGHVTSPGLHELPGGARVADALEAAGGALEGAALEGVNLARPLSDGEQLIVPGPALPGSEAGAAAGGSGPDAAGGGAPAGGGASGAPSAHRPDGTLDLNLATADDLEELPGVGPVLSQRIVDHREANGPFTVVEDLLAVSGIGEKKFAAMAELVSVG